MSDVKREPILFCFCGPSGSGKTTLTREIISKIPATQLSISTTTRAQRGKEVEGKEYFFVDDGEFKRRVEAGLFIEHASFGGKFYGTEKKNLDQVKAAQADLILDIDLQGVASFRKLYPAQTVTIFVFPPSWTTLKDRLTDRATESAEQREKRLQIGVEEVRILSDPKFSDYLVVNDDLPRALERSSLIIQAERLRLSRFSAAERAKLFG